MAPVPPTATRRSCHRSSVESTSLDLSLPAAPFIETASIARYTYLRSTSICGEGPDASPAGAPSHSCRIAVSIALACRTLANARTASRIARSRAFAFLEPLAGTPSIRRFRASTALPLKLEIRGQCTLCDA